MCVCVCVYVCVLRLHFDAVKFAGMESIKIEKGD
jgi:hypothetical protein